MKKNSSGPAEWGALVLLSAALGGAVLLRGGVYPRQWAWSAVAIALALLLVAAPTDACVASPKKDVSVWFLGALLVWMALPLVPLPPSLVAFVSPERWLAISSVRSFTNGNPRAWAALSVAPAATFERLLDVAPAMAAFLAIRTLCTRWRWSRWLLVVPVVLAAWLESLLGMLQFRTLGVRGEVLTGVSGTYVNRDHFAALLEMAFPLALLGGVAAWRYSKTSRVGSAKLALATIGLFFVAASLLLGVTFSSSRMGFASTLAAAGLAGGILLISRGPRVTVRRLAWGWAAAVVLPVCLFVALPTRELLDRYRDLVRVDRISRDARVEIWRDSLAMVASYKWGGCGLGAFEYGFYRFNSRTPMDTVDFAHNDYLQILAELGIVGMVLALTLGLSIVWSLVSLVRAPTGEDWALGVGLLGAFFAIALHSFTDFNLYIPANALVVAWLCGIADSPALRLPSSLC